MNENDQKEVSKIAKSKSPTSLEPERFAEKIIEGEIGKKVIGTRKIMVGIIGISLSVFQLWISAFGVVTPHLQRDVQLCLMMLLAIILFPFRKTKTNIIDKVIDIILFVLALLVGCYLIYEYDNLVLRAGRPIMMDVYLGIIAIILVVDISRRTVGWPLPIVAIVFLIYAYLGPYFPNIIAHRGYDIRRIASFMYTSTEGIYGIAMGASVSFVYIFILFGAFLEKSGAGKFIIDLSYSIAGKAQGGPAKVAVISSGIFGTISGSSVANVVGTGTFTIPLMKRTGYSPTFAAAVEAVASTGGQIMPPVMGAAAFVMAEVLAIPYLSVCIAAAIPAILFYAAVFAAVHFEAGKLGLRGLPASELPNFKNIFKEKIHLLIPLPVLIAFLIIGYTPAKAAVFGIISAFLSSLFRKNTRMGIYDVIDALIIGARNAAGVVMACAAAGIVIGVTTLTGLGFKFSGVIVELAGGNIFLLLIFIMIAAIILGMGLPSVAGYIMLATLATPALIKMGMIPLVAHLYTFYFAISSNITPPVALAAYAAAGIAQANPMKVGFTACRIGLAAFIVPYMIIYGPALAGIGSVFDIVTASISAAFGATLLAGFAIGHFWGRNLNLIERIMLLVASLLLIKPGIYTDAMGIFIFILLMIKIMRRPRIQISAVTK